MNVVSTRDQAIHMPALQAVLEGIAQNGGLFVPAEFPRLDPEQLLQDSGKGYPALAARTLAAYFDIGYAELLALTTEAYAHFDTPEVVPLARLGGNVHVMELFHGPTLAFKDMALQILPRLLRLALAASGRKEDALILTATSGDTGKAALEGFKDVPRTSVLVFYPEDGVAPMQRLQMVTQTGGNVGVCAVKGNFDDAQTGVKQLFSDPSFNAEMHSDGYFLSSANSINIGRLVPQIAYYCHAYAKLVVDGIIRYGDKINVVVPTGNFGNILAAHYARKMGLPLQKLICASNSNNVLTDFFNQGRYNAKREFYKTLSPSMDILVSSNLERLLYEICDRDCAVLRGWMQALQEKGAYSIPAPAREILSQEFYADFCTDDETREAIKNTFDQYKYVADPHTAVALAVYRKYCQATGDTTPTVIASTASPFKFPADVWLSLTGEAVEDDFIGADKLAELIGASIPAQISELKKLPELHREVAEKTTLRDAVRNFIRK